MSLLGKVKAFRETDPQANVVFILVNGTQPHIVHGGPLFHENGTVEALVEFLQERMGSCVSNNAVQRALEISGKLSKGCNPAELGMLSHPNLPCVKMDSME